MPSGTAASSCSLGLLAHRSASCRVWSSRMSDRSKKAESLRTTMWGILPRQGQRCSVLMALASPGSANSQAESSIARHWAGKSCCRLWLPPGATSSGGATLPERKGLTRLRRSARTTTARGSVKTSVCAIRRWLGQAVRSPFCFDTRISGGALRGRMESTSIGSMSVCSNLRLRTTSVALKLRAHCWKLRCVAAEILLGSCQGQRCSDRFSEGHAKRRAHSRCASVNSYFASMQIDSPSPEYSKDSAPAEVGTATLKNREATLMAIRECCVHKSTVVSSSQDCVAMFFPNQERIISNQSADFTGDSPDPDMGERSEAMEK
mmetsp:Transcript_87497/g.248110  ORF Transcript_87497/g.248110 Transcript_87497/m.248110 type:complete len:320 (+) Transcript_87497:320-1279(+)